MMMEHEKEEGYISNQVWMYACHLTPKHCTNVYELLQEKSSMKFSKIVLNLSRQRKNH
jgi:hypothetical protein